MSPKPRTKKAKLIALLSGKSPKSLNQLGKLLGWKRHTVSAAITRLKQEGHGIVSMSIEGGPRVYCAAAAGAEAAQQ